MEDVVKNNVESHYLLPLTKKSAHTHYESLHFLKEINNLKYILQFKLTGQKVHVVTFARCEVLASHSDTGLGVLRYLGQGLFACHLPSGLKRREHWNFFNRLTINCHLKKKNLKTQCEK